MRILGATTRSLESIKPNSIYFVHNRPMIEYAKKILSDLNRKDVEVRLLTSNVRNQFRGRRDISEVRLDHAGYDYCSSEALGSFRELQNDVRAYQCQ